MNYVLNVCLVRDSYPFQMLDEVVAVLKLVTRVNSHDCLRSGHRNFLSL
jgi:hypothetical protein